MTDGRKAAYEEEERDFYQQKIKFYTDKSPQQIYNLMNIMNDFVIYFYKSNPALTSYQWSKIEEIKRAIKVFESNE